MNLIIHGAGGRMGKVISELAQKQGHTIAAAVDMGFPCDDSNAVPPTYRALSSCNEHADCVIDFSNHAATGDLLAFCRARKLPVVIATTGQSDDEKRLIADAAREIPIFYSANMSLGVAIVAELASRAAAALPDADIEIVEIHHNQKLDVPSGTALMLAKRIEDVRPESELVIGRHENGKRQKREIGIHSLRLGNEVGTHEILISTGNEVISLRHEAKNRSLFADGALAAAVWLAGKGAGLYSMQDIIG